MTLSIEENISESFRFAKDGLVGHWGRWILLIILNCIPIVNFIASGYVVKIYRGGDSAPELKGCVEMFIDGLKFTIIGLIYTIIPLILIEAPSIFEIDPISTTGLLLMCIGVILAIIFGLFALIAGVRFAKTESMMEAFNFGAILEKIQEIGWVHYILSYIALIVIIGLIAGALSFVMVLLLIGAGTTSGIAMGAAVAMLAFLVLLILIPVFLLWQGKFYENLYSLA